MKSGCAWCSPSENGTDGICDDCMKQFFGVDPVSIHQEIAQEAVEATVPAEQREEVAA